MLRDRAEASPQAGRLAVWGAKPVVLPEGEFCAAMHETTYLTVVFRLTPLPRFLAELAKAVTAELELLGIPGPTIADELSASFNDTGFAKHSNRSLLGTLNDIGHQLGWALEAEGKPDRIALLRIQHWLNGIPHLSHEPKFVDGAVQLLFANGHDVSGCGQPN